MAKNATPNENDPTTNFQPYTRLTCGNGTYQASGATIYWGYRKGIFGLATQGDLKVFAQHINALLKQSHRVASAVAKLGDDLTSYILQLGRADDDRDRK